MEGDKVLCKNLIKWLKTLNLKAQHSTLEDLSNGVAIAEALTQIAPEYFTPSWNSKVKSDVGNNWRLKVSNLKKILEGVVDYHQDILNLSLQDFVRPDVVKIAELGDPSNVGRLLQLVLSCAVNCNKKEEYITRIMELEISCQRAIMQAIQELEQITLGPNRSSLTLDGTAGNKIVTEADAKEALAQRCHELDIKVKVLEEEKATLLQENANLQSRLSETEIDEPSLGPSRLADVRRQLNAMDERLLHAETQRDDYRDRVELLTKELSLLKLKNEELQISASQTAQLKDEVDALRESAERAQTYEATIDSYKKRLEELVDLKRQVRILESKNVEYVQKSIEYEEDMKKFEVVKGQLEIYKKQVMELNEKLDSEMSKADKLEVENKKLNGRLLAAERERDTALQERDALREACDELRCSNMHTGPSEDNVSRELIPSELKEKVIRLEHENKLLREAQGQQPDVQALLEDYAGQLEKLRSNNRDLQKKVMQMESEHPQEDAQRKVATLETALIEERRKVTTLQETVTAREAEVAATRDKYKQAVEKAKEVIKTLDPKTGQGGVSEAALYARSSAAGAAARHAPPAPAHSEERLISTAWYRLGTACHREAVEQRAALISAAGQSFLSRQRQTAPAKRQQAYKTK